MSQPPKKPTKRTASSPKANKTTKTTKQRRPPTKKTGTVKTKKKQHRRQKKRNFNWNSFSSFSFVKSWNWRKNILRTAYWGCIVFLWLFLAGALYVAYIALKMPQASDWAIPKRPPNIRIVDRYGHLIVDRGLTGGKAIPLKEMSPWLPKAVIAIEDKRFYSHYGIDPIGIMRAFFYNIITGEKRFGGSTLTQQLAKNLFLSPQKTFSRKIQEALLALWLEHKFSKEKILELYLNRVYLGSGAFGVEAASQRYFNKSAKNISLREAAILAGLLKAPSYYSPARDAKIAQKRANIVLAAMRKQNLISRKALIAARVKPNITAPAFFAASGNYIGDEVLEQLPFLIGVSDQDIVVHTSIDLRLEKRAQQAIRKQIKEHRHDKVSQGALITIDKNGAIRALVGGYSYRKSPFNRAIAAKRQPGSAFKIFIYLAALEAGYTPSSLILDAPIKIGQWQPNNFNNRYHGSIPLRQGLALSLNTVAVRLLMDVGIDNIIAMAHRLGIHSGLEENASIALGTSEVSLSELTNAFVPLANGGYRPQMHLIESITDHKGRVLYQFKDQPRRVLMPDTVGMMNNMLEYALKKGTGHNALSSYPAAGKTGTTQNFRDAWFIGYTAHYATGIWFGNDSGAPMHKITGGSLPAIAWKSYMSEAERPLAREFLPFTTEKILENSPGLY